MKRPIPQYVEEMIDDSVSRLNNLKSEDTTSFAFVTDIHNCIDYAERALYAIGKINERHSIAFTCLGGDYLCNNNRTKKEVAINQHRELGTAIEELGKKPVTMVANGNHDNNPFAGAYEMVSREEMYNILMKHHKECFVVNEDDECSMYGYYDVEEAKLRAVFLDSSDMVYHTEGGRVVSTEGGHAVFGNKQINWFANTALKLPDSEWSVVVFSHYSPVPSTVMSERPFGGEAIWEVLSAYKNGSAYKASAKKGTGYYDVECDFTKQGKGNVVAWICGHIHSDRKAYIEGIPVISTSAAASDNFCLSLSDDGTMHYKTRGSGEESAFSVFTVDRKKRILYCIRCGAGPDWNIKY